MPLFAAFFGAFFQALGLFLAKLFAARLAMRLIGVGVLITLSAGLVTAFNEFISPLIAALFSTQYGQFLGLAFPPIAGTVLTGLLSLWLAVFTYRLKVRVVQATTGL